MLPLFALLMSVTCANSHAKSVVELSYCRYYDNCSQPLRTPSCSCDRRTCLRYGNCCHSLDEGNLTGGVDPAPGGAVSCISWFPLDPFFVVTGCPSANDDDVESALCDQFSSARSNGSSFYQLPVFGKETHLVYGNYHCARCNGESDVVYWNVQMNCQRTPLRDDNINENSSTVQPPAANTSVPRYQFFDCSMSIQPPDDDSGYLRSPCGIASCPTNWNDTETISRCRQSDPTLMVYLDRTAYRNLQCALCNGERVEELTCERRGSVRNLEAIELSSPFSILINFNDKSQDVQSTIRTDYDTSFRCPAGQFWDPYRTTCVTTFCPPGTNIAGQSCQSLPSVIVHATKGEQYSTTGNGSRQDQMTTEETHSMNCSNLVAYNETDYSVDSNGTVSLVSRPGIRYRMTEYLIRDSVLYVCNPFNLNTTAGTLPQDNNAQKILTLVGVILSLILLLVLFVVYSVFPVLRNIPGKCLMSLTVSLFVGEFLLLFASNWANASHVICVIQSVLMHYSWLAAFMWMNVLSFDVFRSFSNMSATASSSRDNKTSRCCPPGRFTKYSLYAWTLPALLVSASLIFDLRGDQQSAYRPRYGGSDGTSSVGDNHVCWFNRPRGLLVFFAAPVGLLLAVNIVLFFATIVYIYRMAIASEPAVQSSNHRQMLVISIKLFVVMGLTWIIGFVATMTQWTALWYLYTIFNSLQGALIAVSFLSSRRVRRLLRQSLVDKGYLGSIPASASTAASRDPTYNSHT